MSAPLDNLSAAILAGGMSKRMGRDKAFLPVNGKPLIEIIYERLGAMFPSVVISARDALRFKNYPWTVVTDILPTACPLAGIHAVLTHAVTDYSFVVGCDMPWLDARVIEAMAARLGKTEIVTIESGRGIEPLHTFYSKRCLPRIEACVRSGKLGVMEFIAGGGTTVIRSAELSFLSDPDLPFRNLNTEDEYRKILRGPT